MNLVTLEGTVLSQPHYFYGSRTHCEHEEFTFSTPRGPVDVIDNVGIAPPVQVQPGERVQVRGEMVAREGRPPIVHWTHHDPAGRHPDGFIRLRGREYA